MSAEKLLLLVRDVVQAMVDHPDAVRVTGTVEGRIANVNVKVADADAGMLIGKHGRTARSLRTILGAIGGKVGLRVTLNISEPKLEGKTTGTVTRAEHLAWAKLRAHEICDRGDLDGAIDSMLADLCRHPELAQSSVLGAVSAPMYRPNPWDVKKWIDGFK